MRHRRQPGKRFAPRRSHDTGPPHDPGARLPVAYGDCLPVAHGGRLPAAHGGRLPAAHGGRLIEAMRRHPDATRPWIDLSTGINPNAYPFTPPSPEAWRRLPEPEEVAGLETAAAQAYGVPDPACVVAAPGTQALIQLIPRLFPQRRIAIPGPTYAEHEAAWCAAGSTIAPDASALVLCNPNNPDGRRHDPAALAARIDGLLVVDEAYADFEPALSLAGQCARTGLIILRSFGKAYGLAGIRLGFALASPDVAATIRTALGPWPINGPAIAIARQALADTAWRIDAGQAALQASARLNTLLLRSELRPVGGTPLFRTVEERPAVAERLAASGILVRTFPAQAWLRLGLRPDDQAWSRLTTALNADIS